MKSLTHRTKESFLCVFVGSFLIVKTNFLIYLFHTLVTFMSRMTIHIKRAQNFEIQ